MSTPSSFSAYGAVDLGALAARSQAQATTRPGPAATGGGGYVVDVTEATFETEVVQRSLSVPVVIDLWATWCEPCKQLSPVLERLAAADGGRWVLAKVDVDANPRISQAFQVQSIPSVVAVVKGQPVPLFQGALPEAQVRQYLDQLLQLAAANGVTGTAAPVGGPDGADGAAGPAEPPHDPRYDEAYDAIERGDYDAAARAYQGLLAQSPADAEARAGLAQVELLRRTAALDLQRARAAAAERPDDVAAQLDVADLDLLGGHVEDAFTRLVDTVRRTSGAEREAVRTRLVELFEVVGTDDPRVLRARQALASALF